MFEVFFYRIFAFTFTVRADRKQEEEKGVQPFFNKMVPTIGQMTCGKWFLSHIHPINQLRNVLEIKENSMGHTTEGASEGVTGVMWNLPSSILHIHRIHGEHMLWKKETWINIINSRMWSIRQYVSKQAVLVF